ncbi:MAG: 2-C-methyl-D-erythritol 4-phosphate cytidylyltransferase [Planctomycetota bacterium]|jgi:2-C-methyl-D-erythritol 4-phosphate cytidylyltransferase
MEGASGRGRPACAAVLLAAGHSSRMSAGDAAPSTRKPFLELDGRSLLAISLASFAAAKEIDELVLVTQPEDKSRVDQIVATSPARSLVRAQVAGGQERVDSVRAGVLATSATAELVLVHDVARPFVTAAQIDAVARAVREHGAALLAIPISDSVKASDDGTSTRESLDRSRLWAAQTPQGIRREIYLEVLDRASDEGFEPTDDAALYERYVGAVRLVEGSALNFKITTQTDLALATALIQSGSLT